MATVVLGIEFNDCIDRDDSLLARFEIKYNGGALPMEVRPSLLELLQPCMKNRREFDGATRKLQGFNCVDSSFSLPSASSLVTRKWVSKNGNLTPIKEDNKVLDGMRFAGSLPSSGDTVFVFLCCTSQGGNVTVWCEQALAANCIVHALKKAIVEARKP